MPAIFYEKYRHVFGQIAKLSAYDYGFWKELKNDLILEPTGGAFVEEKQNGDMALVDNTVPATSVIMGWCCKSLSTRMYKAKDHMRFVNDRDSVFQLPYNAASEAEAITAVEGLRIGEKIGVKVVGGLQKADKTAATKFLEVVDTQLPGRGFVCVKLV